jgi:ATP-binding cassette subfamily G (WHITE) protein 2 (SNQ2)
MMTDSEPSGAPQHTDGMAAAGPADPPMRVESASGDDDTMMMAKDDGDVVGGGQSRIKDDLILSFENLTVHVPGKKRSCCNFAANPLANFAQEFLGMQIREHEPFDAISDISGYLASAHMCLVMGGRQQSRSTLLRTLSGRSSEQDETSGTVLLNGMPLARSLQGWRRLCPYISAADNTHSPVLTVRETFSFAAECTSDGKQPTSEINGRVGRMMEALSLENVADTVVGDENLRGVSGGQKRRVTVGEMAIDRETTFLFCENVTDGLSSSDSLQILQRLRRACKSYNFGAMVTLMQPSDEMIDLFDSIMVLTTSGELAYFGPVDRAALTSIFTLTKDRNVTGEEYTGSVADLVEDYIVQPNADELEATIRKRYATSKTCQEVLGKLDEIRSAAPPKGDRDVADLLPPSKYSTNGWYQFSILMARRKKLIMRNAVTWTRIMIAIIFGIIIGSLFSELSRGLEGALGRTGYLFLNCFLVLMLSAAVTIPSSFRERVTLFKHRSGEFYSGRIAYVVQIITDMPLSLLEAILLSSVSYFWVDMRAGPGPFFYFMFTLIGLEFVGQALGRLLCALLRCGRLTVAPVSCCSWCTAPPPPHHVRPISSSFVRPQEAGKETGEIPK